VCAPARRSALLGALGLGSVSSHLLRAAAVPVCVVPRSALAAPPP
jgi:nucleotide-binding universal stress UspA family protein